MASSKVIVDGATPSYCRRVRLWKIGLATLAGVVRAGVAVQRKRRAYRDYDTAELRDRLRAGRRGGRHRRLTPGFSSRVGRPDRDAAASPCRP